MLDQFYSGEATRISPEAPVPVLKIQDCDTMPGGAANTAMNIGCLGARVRLVAPVGDDQAGRDLRGAISSQFDVQFETIDDPRGTTIKTRYSAQGQQLLRIDREDLSALPKEQSDQLRDKAIATAASADLIVLSDYAKGALNADLCQAVIQSARSSGIPCVVDPKGTDFSKYRGATIITPNEMELMTVIGRKASSDAELIADARSLIDQFELDYVALTRGKLGVVLIGADGQLDYVPSFARDVFDVSGAGDSFVAGLSCAIASGEPVSRAIHYGNAVAGVAVGKSGTAMVSRDEVEALFQERGRPAHAPVTRDYAHSAEIIRSWQQDGQKVGFTNGVFDLLHLGHLRILNETRKVCDKLVVAMNADSSVKRLKGDERPIQPEELRAQVLSNMKQVDLVVIFAEDTPFELISTAAPDVLVKGGDYIAEEVVGYKEVRAVGGEVLIVPTLHGYSTTSTVRRMIAADE